MRVDNDCPSLALDACGLDEVGVGSNADRDEDKVGSECFTGCEVYRRMWGGGFEPFCGGAGVQGDSDATKLMFSAGGDLRFEGREDVRGHIDDMYLKSPGCKGFSSFDANESAADYHRSGPRGDMSSDAGRESAAGSAKLQAPASAHRRRVLGFLPRCEQ
jgi:hypothetical protein